MQCQRLISVIWLSCLSVLGLVASGAVAAQSIAPSETVVDIYVSMRYLQSNRVTPYKQKLQSIRAENGGKESDLYCETDSGGDGVFSCVIDMNTCDDTLPFDTVYHVEFEPVRYFTPRPEAARIVLSKCAWKSPENLRVDVPYYYNAPPTYTASADRVSEYLQLAIPDFSFEAPLAESDTVFKSLRASGLTETKQLSEFAAASRELSAIYGDAARKLSLEIGDQELIEELNRFSGQYSAYATYYANSSLQDLANIASNQAIEQQLDTIVVSGAVKDYEENLEILTEFSDSIIEALQRSSSIPGSQRQTIINDYRGLLTQPALANDSFRYLNRINVAFQN